MNILAVFISTNPGFTFKRFKNRGFCFFRIWTSLVTVLLCLQTATLFSQPDTSSINQHLFSGDTVVVTGHRSLFSGLDLSTTYDRIIPAAAAGDHHLADVLSHESGISLKAYGGAEALHSLSIRGGSGEQSLILFDGIPLNNLQNGSIDLVSQMLDGVASVEIYRGGNSTLFGSGAMSGAINIAAAAVGERTYSAGISTESFGNRLYQGALHLPGKDLKQRLLFSRAFGDNVYRYTQGGVTGKRSNSDFSRWMGDYLFEYALPGNYQLTGQAVFGSKESGSPSALLNAGSYQGVARLSDQNRLLRLKLSPVKQSRIQLSLQLYQLHQESDYYDADLLINGVETRSEHRAKTTGLILRNRIYPVKNLLLHQGMELILAEARSSELAVADSRKQLALFSLMQWQSPAWQSWQLLATAGLRMETLNRFSPAWLPRMGIQVKRKSLALYANAGRNYRVPTFNDLYWQPGGNPGLKPENSISYEAGASINQDWWQVRSAIYLLKFNNMIRWVPVSGSVWEPRNLQSVNSSGWEIVVQGLFFDDRLSVSAAYENGIARKSGSAIADDPTIGNRLAYNPKEQVHFKTELHHWNARLGARYRYSGFRYTTLANLADDFLPAYSVIDIYASYAVELGGRELILSGSFDNLLQEEYQLINNYPLPIYYWRLGVAIKGIY